MRHPSRCAVYFCAWSVATFAAQNTAIAAPKVVTRANSDVTVVEFGDDTIEGDLSKPDGAYLESRKKLRHERLIRVRESFREQILQSIRAL